jgi:acetolactate synthase-1/2/3 large subunit
MVYSNTSSYPTHNRHTYTRSHPPTPPKQANRAHTYLGKYEAEFHVTKAPEDIFPDFVTLAKAFGVPARRVFKPEELRPAIQEMLATPGPYLLDVMVPHIQHVLPMIPGGGSFKDVITKGDGLDDY